MTDETLHQAYPTTSGTFTGNTSYSPHVLRTHEEACTDASQNLQPRA